MPKNSSDMDMWKAEMMQAPDHDIAINGKEAVGLRDFLEKLAVDRNYNWWELAHVLLWHSVEQIAAADLQAQDTQAISNFAISLSGMYAAQRRGLTDGSSTIVSPTSDDTIN